MTEDVAYAFSDEETEEVLERMKVLQVRRLAILDRDKTLVGIVALGDIATEPDAAARGPRRRRRWPRFQSRRGCESRAYFSRKPPGDDD